MKKMKKLENAKVLNRIKEKLVAYLRDGDRRKASQGKQQEKFKNTKYKL